MTKRIVENGLSDLTADILNEVVYPDKKVQKITSQVEDAFDELLAAIKDIPDKALYSKILTLVNNFRDLSLDSECEIAYKLVKEFTLKS